MATETGQHGGTSGYNTTQIALWVVLGIVGLAIVAYLLGVF